jgi:hypothetical protein
LAALLGEEMNIDDALLLVLCTLIAALLILGYI